MISILVELLNKTIEEQQEEAISLYCRYFNLFCDWK